VITVGFGKLHVSLPEMHLHLPTPPFIVVTQKDSITNQNKRTAEFIAICESVYYCVSSRKVAMIFL
jgi:hypothetical protein